MVNQEEMCCCERRIFAVLPLCRKQAAALTRRRNDKATEL